MKTKKEPVYLPNEKEVFAAIKKQPYTHINTLDYHTRAGGAIEDTNTFYNEIYDLARQQYRKLHIYLDYAQKVLKGRFPIDFEKKFFLCGRKDNSNGLWSHDPSIAFNYAKLIIKNRLPEEYEKGCNYKHYVFHFVKKGHKAEDILKNCKPETWLNYFLKFNTLPEEIHNRFLAIKMADDADWWANQYFKRNKDFNNGIYEKLKNMDPNKTIGEFLIELGVK